MADGVADGLIHVATELVDLVEDPVDPVLDLGAELALACLGCAETVRHTLCKASERGFERFQRVEGRSAAFVGFDRIDAGAQSVLRRFDLTHRARYALERSELGLARRLHLAH